ncbi:MAG: hypothetical protein KBD01_03040 [Acidobacteria bacterium]|nr:hypothetical protein [Acidobacteriota bacterium]
MANGSVVETTTASILARLLRSEAEAVLAAFAESLEALVGRKVDVEPLPAGNAEIPILFGDRELYVFPIEAQSGTTQPALLALDLPGAVYLGASLSLMGPEQVNEVLGSGEIPEILHDSIGEVANILCGGVAKIVRLRAPSGTPEFRRGPHFERRGVGAWPDLLSAFDPDPAAPWDVLGGRLSLAGADSGTFLWAASGRKRKAAAAEKADPAAATGSHPATEPRITAPQPIQQPAAPAPAPREAAASPERRAKPEPAPAASPQPWLPSALLVQVTGHPADAAVVGLRSVLDAAGASVLPSFSPVTGAQGPGALFVVSRSPVDLKSRLESIAPGRRPPLVVACSDRPTRELVQAARAAGADDFLVLPAAVDRLATVLRRFISAEAPA